MLPASGEVHRHSALNRKNGAVVRHAFVGRVIENFVSGVATK